jgi:hypothetical protein
LWRNARELSLHTFKPAFKKGQETVQLLLVNELERKTNGSETKKPVEETNTFLVSSDSFASGRRRMYIV